MDKKFLIILSVLVLGFVGYLIASKRDNGPVNDNGEQLTSETSNTFGEGNKGVEIVEFADFQCPACAGFAPLVQELKNRYSDEVKFVFRHFPLDTIHPNARAAHRAAEAAARQGKFFEMHDLLFQNQRSWGTSQNIRATLDSYAVQLGLDMDRFSADFLSEETNASINSDINLGKSKLVNATPTFFINDRQINNEEIRSFEQFARIIDEEIKKSAASQESAD